MSRRLRGTLWGLAVGASWMAMACGWEPPELPAAGDVSYAAVVEPVFVRRCLSCHGGGEPKAQLVLDEGVGYSQLAGRHSVQVDRPLVTAGDPEGSYLWLKLDDRAEVGDGMPRTVVGYRRLPERELRLVKAWIERGARR